MARATAESASGGPRRPATEQEVLDTVSDYYGVSENAIKGRKRDKATALARQVAMYLLREDANMGASAIGRALGGKNHATVLRGSRTIETRQNVDANLRADIIAITQRAGRGVGDPRRARRGTKRGSQGEGETGAPRRWSMRPLRCGHLSRSRATNPACSKSLS